MLGMKPHGTEWRLDRKVMVGPREKDERETEREKECKWRTEERGTAVPAPPAVLGKQRACLYPWRQPPSGMSEGAGEEGRG